MGKKRPIKNAGEIWGNGKKKKKGGRTSLRQMKWGEAWVEAIQILRKLMKVEKNAGSSIQGS